MRECAPPGRVQVVVLTAALALQWLGSAVAQAQAVPDAPVPGRGQRAEVAPMPPASPPPVPDEGVERSFAEKVLDTPHEFVSRRVESYSRVLDSFFGDPNRVYDRTGSTLQIRSHATYYSDGVRERRTDVHANIVLPNTEERLHLLVQRGIEAATQTAAERDIENTTGTAPGTTVGTRPDRGFFLGLKALTAEVLGAELSAEAGVKFGRPVSTYARLRAVRNFTVGQWLGRASETPLWTSTDGRSAATEFDMIRPIDDRWQFRSTSKATWRETTGYFDLAQIGAFIYSPGERTTITFELGAFAPSDRNVHAAVYSATVRIRRQIYRDWLYLEVTPQLLYREVSRYAPVQAIMVQMELLFGDSYL